MSVLVMAQALEALRGPTPDMVGATPAERLLVVVMADYADKHGICWPTPEQLARQVGLSVRSVMHLLENLEHAGVIARHLPAGPIAWRLIFLDRGARAA